MNHRLADLIDVGEFSAMMRSFYEATGIPHGLIDVDDNILSGIGWQDICVKCHRSNPASLARCHESDHYIAEHLLDGPFVGYQCLNGLMDYATPVIVEGQHLATIFVGQFLHAPPDLDYFRRQAREFGFEEASYLAEVAKLPIIPQPRVEAIMRFYAGLARMLAAKGLDRLRQRQAEAELRALNAELGQRVEARTRELTDANQRLCAEIAERQAIEDALRSEKQLSEDIINGLPGIFYMFDARGRFVRWNARLGEVSGYSNDEIGRLHPLGFFTADDAGRVGRAIERTFRDGESSVEAALVCRNGRPLPYYFSGRRTILNGEPYLVGQGVDIGNRVALERKLEIQANTDPLTGLANRRHFLELAEHELARSERYKGPLSVLMLDLDRFKTINDSHGHHVGDLALQAVGEIIRSTLRAVDIVGRIGGEEFAVLLPETDVGHARELAERLRRNIEAARIAIPQGELRLTASIGVTSPETQAASIHALLDAADQALYRAKREGRNRVALL